MRFGNSSLTHVRRVCYNFSQAEGCHCAENVVGRCSFLVCWSFPPSSAGIYGPAVRATASSADELKDAVSQFTNVLAVVQQNYAIPIDSDHAFYNGAIPGMLRVLDPHSTFFDPREYALLREDQRGKYYGVGMTVGPQKIKRSCSLRWPVRRRIEAGIRPGDIISRVDGKAHRRADHVGSCRPAQRAERHGRARDACFAKAYDQPITFAVTRDEIPKHRWTWPSGCDPASAM